MNISSRHRPVVFGEVLFDRFPDGSVVLGGAPFNVAWHLQAFGAEPLFVSRVGDDELGRRILDTMGEWGMDTGGVQQDTEHPTGTVEVRFEAGEPRYDIVEGRAYDFVAADALPAPAGAALVYHGSLALRGPVSRDAFGALAEAAGAPRFMDVNLRSPWWRRDAVDALMRQATWLKLNHEELDLLAPGANPQTLCRDYGLEALILTRGAAGAELWTEAEVATVAPETGAALVDTVGAGDAFASVILLGLLSGWPPGLIVQRAQAFAGAIVGVRGATVADPAFYSTFQTQWQLPG